MARARRVGLLPARRRERRAGALVGSARARRPGGGRVVPRRGSTRRVVRSRAAARAGAGARERARPERRRGVERGAVAPGSATSRATSRRSLPATSRPSRCGGSTAGCACSSSRANLGRASAVKVYAWQGPGLFEVRVRRAGGDRLSRARHAARRRLPALVRLDTSSRVRQRAAPRRGRNRAGVRTLDLRRGTSPLKDDVLDVDVAGSPLFNSLPVLRDRLARGRRRRRVHEASAACPSSASFARRYVPSGTYAVGGCVAVEPVHVHERHVSCAPGAALGGRRAAPERVEERRRLFSGSSTALQRGGRAAGRASDADRRPDQRCSPR